MTIIAVKKYADKIEICADSQTTCGHNKNCKDINKLVEVQQGFIIGQCGTLSEANLLFHYAMTRKPERSDCLSILDYLLEFQAWRKLKTNEDKLENHHIIIFDKKIYHHEYYDVKQIDDYAATGSGYNEALAALYLGRSAYEAVEVACALTLYCNLPIKKIEIPL